MNYSLILPVALAAVLAGGPAAAQNAISQDGWEGFAIRDADNKFDRCILYNRTIQALTASPHDMIGITRDTADRTGLLVFFGPRSLTRGALTIRIVLDQKPAIEVAGEALSDFHAAIPALDPPVVVALRAAQTLEASADGKSVTVDIKAGAAVLDRLDACVKSYGPKR